MFDVSQRRRFLSETYGIKDYLYASDMTSNDNHITFGTGVTYNYSSDGLTMTSSNDTENIADFSVPNDAVMTGKIKFGNQKCQFPHLHHCCFYHSDSNYMACYDELDPYGWANRTQVNDVYITLNTWYDFKIEFEGNTVKLYLNNNLIISKTVSTRTSLQTDFMSRNTSTIKDIQIKPL